jgi:hypothetical protein
VAVSTPPAGSNRYPSKIPRPAPLSVRPPRIFRRCSRLSGGLFLPCWARTLLTLVVPFWRLHSTQAALQKDQARHHRVFSPELVGHCLLHGSPHPGSGGIRKTLHAPRKSSGEWGLRRILAVLSLLG